jgi:hypothetical protein
VINADCQQLGSAGSAAIAQQRTPSPPPASTMIANQPAARPPQALLIPTQSLPQGDLAGYLACLDTVDTVNHRCWRRIGVLANPAATPLTAKRAASWLLRCMISAALYTGSRSSTSQLQTFPSNIRDKCCFDTRRTPLDCCINCLPSDSCRSGPPQLDVEELRYPLITPWSG